MTRNQEGKGNFRKQNTDPADGEEESSKRLLRNVNLLSINQLIYR